MRSSPLLAFAAVALVLVAIGVASFVLFMPSPTPGAPGATPDTTPTVTPAPGAKPAAAELAPSAAPKTAEATPPAPVSETAPAGAAPEAEREAVKVAEAEPKGFAKGIVLDFDGSPARGVKVFIVSKSGGISFMGADTETNEKGEFFVSTSVKKKKTLKLRMTRKDRLPVTVDDVVFKPKETFDAGIVRFLPSGSLEVTVQDSDGRPIPNSTVKLDTGDKSEDSAEVAMPAPSNEERAQEANDRKFRNDGLQRLAERGRTQRMTNDEGVAVFPALAVGKVKVKAEPPSAGFDSEQGRVRSVKPRVSVGFQGNRRDVTEIVEKDAGGEPDVKPEPLADSETKPVDIVAGTPTRLALKLEGLGVLTGRATIHGEPLANVYIGLHAASTSGSFFGKLGMSVRAKTDGDGKFAFPPVAPGDYVVKKGDPGPSFNFLGIGDEGGGMEEIMGMVEKMMTPSDSPDKDLGRQVDILRGANRFDIDFGGAAIEVFVQDLDSGQVIADATIRMFDHEPKAGGAKPAGVEERLAKSFLTDPGKRPVRLRVKSDGRGRAEFKEVQGGKYRIIARASGRPPSLPSDFEVVEGQYSRVLVKIPRGTAVAGTVNDRNGNAIKSATVNLIFDRELEPAFPDELLSMLMTGGPSVMTDAKGAFRVEGLEEGRRLLLATAEGFAPAALHVQAPSEGNMLFLEKPGTIRVTVVRDGKPEVNAMVRLDTDAEDAPIPAAAWSSFALVTQIFGSKIATTNDKGVAVLTNIPPGEWNVAVADFAAPVNDAESTKKAIEGLRDASLKASEVQPEASADPGIDTGAGKAKEGVAFNNKLESLFKRKKARVRVYPEQEATARVELGK